MGKTQSDVIRTELPFVPGKFVAAGFKKHTSDPLNRDKDGYITSFQKRVTDDRGTRYFIDVAQFRFILPGRCDMEHYGITGQFCRNGGKQTFNVDMFSSGVESVVDIEEFFDAMWRGLKCDYYECWGGDERHVPQDVA